MERSRPATSASSSNETNTTTLSYLPPWVLFDKQGNRVSVDFDEISDDVDIPEFINEHYAEFRFPEKLMLLMTHIERECVKKGENPDKACISWTRDGRSLIIRNNKIDFVKHNVPTDIFRVGKFSSFTRKLYRWGFRQKLPGKGAVQPLQGVKIFYHRHFQRDNKKLLVNMRSITAEGTRRATLTKKVVSRFVSSPLEQHQHQHQPAGGENGGLRNFQDVFFPTTAGFDRHDTLSARAIVLPPAPPFPRVHQLPTTKGQEGEPFLPRFGINSTMEQRARDASLLLPTTSVARPIAVMMNSSKPPPSPPPPRLPRMSACCAMETSIRHHPLLLPRSLAAIRTQAQRYHHDMAWAREYLAMTAASGGGGGGNVGRPAYAASSLSSYGQPFYQNRTMMERNRATDASLMRHVSHHNTAAAEVAFTPQGRPGYHHHHHYSSSPSPSR